MSDLQRTVCIEGWRGVNHSFAMVNQNQLLELLKMPRLKVFHRDMKLFLPEWKQTLGGGGFSAEESKLIAEVPTPGHSPIDVTLRMVSPYSSAPFTSRKTVNFFVVNFGAIDMVFDADPGDLSRFTVDGNLVVTPTTWTRDRLVEYGFDADGIRVVPHGVKTDTFFPISPEDRAQKRLALGIRPEEVLFLNVGGVLWNKGQDVLLYAFAVLRKRGYPVRLFLKDSRHLFRATGDDLIAAVNKSNPGLMDANVLKGISTVPNELTLEQMRDLHCVADAYVSPYRAEGFNLPVLEALACGRTAIVSAGGATDDFCPPELVRKISTRLVVDKDKPRLPFKYVEPNPDSLIAEMERVVREHGSPYTDHLSESAKSLRHQYSWRSVTEQLAAHL